MMHAIRHVSGNVLWANIYLLFWLSLIPFASGWMGENHFATIPVAIYRIVVCMCGIAYYILAQFLIKLHGKDSILELALGRDRKGVLSVLIYIAGILLSFIHPMLGVSLYTVVAVIWFIPDTRIEKRLNPD